ncbi:MAG: hypothetical protein ACQESR_10035 [Planctomycetota bacterium]
MGRSTRGVTFPRAFTKFAMDCPECHVGRYENGFADGLSLADSSRLVKTLADWGVFELAIGDRRKPVAPVNHLVAHVALRNGARHGNNRRDANASLA